MVSRGRLYKLAVPVRAMQSPFGAYASHTESAPAEGEIMFGTSLGNTKERRQDAGTSVVGQGSHRFDATATSTAALCSDDTAYRRPDTTPLERNSSLFARSSRNISRLSKRFSDSRASTAATSETVKLAQEQQQTNRQNAAPVLKAVPSTKVGMSSLSCKHA